jgi:hypothetical protein
MNDLLQRGPANGNCYTDEELDAEPVLGDKVRAERRKKWDDGATRLPVVSAGKSHRNKSGPASLSLDLSQDHHVP